MRSPIFNSFGKVISSASVAAWPLGPVAAGANTLGSDTVLIASGTFTDDCYGIFVSLNGVWVSAAARAFGVNIYAGGTLIIERLIASGPHTHGFLFPVFVKSGQAISARASGVAAASVGVHIKLFCRPSRPDTIWCGSNVTAYGASGANTYGGTATTAGTSGAKGTYVSLGTVARRTMYWELGASFVGTESTMGDQNQLVDLAVGASTTANQLVYQDVIVSSEGTENTAKSANPFEGFMDTAAGLNIYARSARSANTTDSPEVIAYGVS